VVVGLVGFSFAPPASAQSFRVLTRFRAYREPVVLDTLTRPYTFAAPIDSVHRALLQTASDFKLTTDLNDLSRGLVGVSRLNRSGNLGGQRMSRYLHCGSGFSGPYADTYRLSLTIVALEDRVGRDSTRVGFAIVGEGQSTEGNSSEPVACTSNGVFELRWAQAVAKALGLPPPKP
jgi:hypothetical protein